MSSFDSDTLVMASSEENFAKLFLREHSWNDVVIDDRRVKCLKWLALYRIKPVSAITHYAAIVSAHKVSAKGRYVFHLGEPIALAHEIGKGGKKGIPFQGQRYMFLEQLLKAKDVTDLLEARRSR